MRNQMLYRPAGVILLIVLWLMALTIGCAFDSRFLPMPEDLAALGIVRDDADLDRLMRGRVVAVTECAECHRFYWPEEYTPEEWKGILTRMSPMSSLNRRQAEDLEAYMLASARITRASPGLPEKR